MTHNKYLKYLLLFSIISFGKNVNSAELSKKAVFYRCYRQITQNFVDPNHDLVKQIERNEIDPITACLSVLDKANFVANENKQIADTTDQEAINVLRTFQNLHYSWFSNKLLDSGIGFDRYSLDVVDIGEPALFYTRALFTPGYEYKNVFLGSTNYETQRLGNQPAQAPNSKLTRDQYAPMTPEIPFLTIGPLIGYSSYNGVRRYEGTRGTGEPIFQLGNHWGGGYLGSSSYMLMNVLEGRDFKSTGSVGVPRKWSKNVLLDSVCRELPVIRYDDGLTYLSSNTNSPTFRQQGACVRCHVTMDRMSGVIRNVRPRNQGFDASGAGGNVADFIHMEKWNTELSGAATWTESSDKDFYRRPLLGHFLYRTFDGKKIDQALTGVESLGQLIGSLDDPYVCTAKRYYYYFTGIDANIDDIADPQYGRSLSSAELIHRNEVIALGKSFKAHQNMKKLIEDILRKPQFKDSAYQNN